MCGIFGFLTENPSKENYEMFKDICYVSAVRGTDATGVAILTPDKVIIDKAPIESPTFIKSRLPKHMKDIEKANVVIGHTRKWTQGEPKDNNNNHPVSSDNWIMVHNGCCPSMDRIKGYKYKGEVDSEILLSYVETKGLEKGLEELKGYAAVALMNKKEPGVVYLWRHNEGLWAGYDRGTKTIFFGSTDSIMETSLANEFELFTSYQIRKIPEHMIIRITANPLNVEFIKEVEPKKYTYYESMWNKDKDKDKKTKSYGYGGSSSAYDEDPTSFVWDTDLGILVPRDMEGEESDNEESKIPNKWWFIKERSNDFVYWDRENGYHESIDGKFVKIWDKEKKAHFLMTLADAVKEGILHADE